MKIQTERSKSVVFEPRPISLPPFPIFHLSKVPVLAVAKNTWLPLCLTLSLRAFFLQDCPQPSAADTKSQTSISKAGAPMYNPNLLLEQRLYLRCGALRTAAGPNSYSAQLMRQWYFHSRRSKPLHAPHSHPIPSHPSPPSAPRSRMPLRKDGHCPHPWLQNPDMLPNLFPKDLTLLPKKAWVS